MYEQVTLDFRNCININLKGEFNMKKMVCSIAAVAFLFCLMLSAGAGLAGAADVDKDMMMDNGMMMMENGKIMMDKGQMMIDKGMKIDGEMMMKDGKKMMKHGKKMMKKSGMGEGKMMEKKEMMEKSDMKEMNK